MRFELGFIGAGNMAEAIARAAIGAGIVRAEAMIAADPSDARRAVFAAMGIVIAADNAEVIRQSKQIMLAIKPQTLPTVGEELAGIDVERQIVLSIMAGIRCAKIEGAAGKPVRVVRIMPNTPLTAGLGMAGVALGSHARAGDDALAMSLFGAAGRAIRVAESDLDAITAVSGSGPAYVFYLAEAMRKAAEELGLTEHAAVLVEQTILGSAQLLKQSDDTPEELRRKVTSPGGTTEAAIRTMNEMGVAEAIVKAIKAAQQRSVELGK